MIKSDKRKEYEKQYYLKNKDKILAYAKANHLRRTALKKERFLANPEKKRAFEALYRKNRASKSYLNKELLRSKKNIAEYKQITEPTIKGRPWSSEEIEYLNKNFRDITTLEMALYLDRTWRSVGRKLFLLRLVKLPHRHNK